MRSTLLSSILNLATDRSQWDIALSELRSALGAHSICVGAANLSRDKVAIPEFVGLDSQFESNMMKYCTNHNIYYRYLGELPLGSIFSNRHMDNLEGRGTFYRQPFYRDFLRSLDIDHLLSSLVFADNESRVTVSVGRDQDRGPWTPSELNLMGEAACALEHSLRVSKYLQHAQIKERAAEAIVGGLSSALFVLDHNAKLLYCNSAAESILSCETYFSSNRRTLVGVSSKIQREFQRELYTLTNHARSNDVRHTTSGSFWVTANDVPAQVTLCPLGSSDPVFGHLPGKVLMVISKLKEKRIDRDIIQERFQLTRQEAALSALLVEGKNLKSAASLLGITYETARGYLKTTTQKLNVKGQTGLIRKVLETT